MGGREVGLRWEERGEEGVAGRQRRPAAAAAVRGGQSWTRNGGDRRMEGRVENLERGGVEINRQKGGEEQQK